MLGIKLVAPLVINALYLVWFLTKRSSGYRQAETSRPAWCYAVAVGTAVAAAWVMIETPSGSFPGGVSTVVFISSSLQLGYVAAIIDGATGKLPLPITQLLYVHLVLWRAMVGSLGDGALRTVMLSALIWIVPMLGGFFFKQSVGLGDVLWAGPLGMGLGALGGFTAAAAGILLALLAAGVYAVFLFVFSRASSKRRLPLGPFLYFGVAAVCCSGLR